MTISMFKRVFAVITALMMVFIWADLSYAAHGTPSGGVGSKSTDKAVLTVGKTLTAKSGSIENAVFQFDIEAVQAKDGRTMTDIPTAQIPMPQETTVQVNFTKGETSPAQHSVSFPAMTYQKPGYYMYKITERTDSSKTHITYDENYYYVLVYVTELVDLNGNTTSAVEVNDITSWHQLSGSEETLPNLDDIARDIDNGGEAAFLNSNGEDFGKVDSTRFVNGIDSHDILIEKTVKGNLGDMNKKFSVTAELTGLEPGVTYSITTESGTPSLTAETVTASAQGSAVIEAGLGSGDAVRISNIPTGASYAIQEASNNHIAGYTVTSDSTETGAKAPVIACTGKSNTSQDTALVCETETVDSTDGTITVTLINSRDLATVTGLGIAAYPMILALLLLLPAVAFLRRKRYADSDVNLI